jgi:hypothetical protein
MRRRTYLLQNLHRGVDITRGNMSPRPIPDYSQTIKTCTRILRNLLSQLQMKCQNHKYGFPKIIRIDELSSQLITWGYQNRYLDSSLIIRNTNAVPGWQRLNTLLEREPGGVLTMQHQEDPATLNTENGATSPLEQLTTRRPRSEEYIPLPPRRASRPKPILEFTPG